MRGIINRTSATYRTAIKAAPPPPAEMLVDESMMRDAARYRWLRDTQNTDCRDSGEAMEKAGVVENIFICNGDGAYSPHSIELNAAIDAAMEGKK